MSKKLVIYQGSRFERLTSLYEIVNPDSKGQHWLCQCECGDAIIAAAFNLMNGNTKSCGCLRKSRLAEMNTTHGYARAGADSRAYRIWVGMLNRCAVPTNSVFSYYGGRGITVCDRWKNFTRFLEDMGEPPSSRHTIDRIDSNGNYAPDNCRWATTTEQARNKRTSHFLTYQGETLTIAEWSERLGLDYKAIFARITKYQWSAEEALSTPVRKLRKRKTHDSNSI